MPTLPKGKPRILAAGRGACKPHGYNEASHAPGHAMLAIDRETLLPLARRYIWWKPPEEAVRQPRRVIAQVMNLGDWEDARAMQAELGDAVLRDALAHAEAGEFTARSWAFWHYRLGMADPGTLPPLPVRHIG